MASKFTNEHPELVRVIHPLTILHEDPTAWFNVFNVLALKVLNMPDGRSGNKEIAMNDSTDYAGSKDQDGNSSEDDEEWQDAQEVLPIASLSREEFRNLKL